MISNWVHLTTCDRLFISTPVNNIIPNNMGMIMALTMPELPIPPGWGRGVAVGSAIVGVFVGNSCTGNVLVGVSVGVGVGVSVGVGVGVFVAVNVGVNVTPSSSKGTRANAEFKSNTTRYTMLANTNEKHKTVINLRMTFPFT